MAEQHLRMRNVRTPDESRQRHEGLGIEGTYDDMRPSAGPEFPPESKFEENHFLRIKALQVDHHPSEIWDKLSELVSPEHQARADTLAKYLYEGPSQDDYPEKFGASYRLLNGTYRVLVPENFDIDFPSRTGLRAGASSFQVHMISPDGAGEEAIHRVVPRPLNENAHKHFALLQLTRMTSHPPKVAGEVHMCHQMCWTAKEAKFTLGDNLCNVRTNGMLISMTEPEHVLSILATSCIEREMRPAKVEWQNACQMAAWISRYTARDWADSRLGLLLADSPHSRSRFMLSLNYTSWYIIIGDYDIEWIVYIQELDVGWRAPSVIGRRVMAMPAAQSAQASSSTTTASGQQASLPARVARLSLGDEADFEQAKGTPRHEGYLTMHTFGPYRVDSVASMVEFNRIVLALMLQAAEA